MAGKESGVKITIRLSEKEYANLMQALKEHDSNISDFVRDSIDKNIKSDGFNLDAEIIKAKKVLEATKKRLCALQELNNVLEETEKCSKQIAQEKAKAVKNSEKIKEF